MSLLKKSPPRKEVTRRGFLKSSVAASAALMLGPTFWPNHVLAVEGKILKIRNYSDIRDLDPGFSINLYDCIHMYPLYRGLVTYKPGKTWGWQLDAAEQIEQVDPTHITFKLKPGIMFTNDFGEMTAEDVKYSFERIIDPKNESQAKNHWAKLDHVEVTGKYSGTIVFSSPYQAVWMTTLPHAPGRIISKKAVESVGGRFTTTPPCFSGPYVLKEWKPKQFSVFARNELYSGPAPEFDQVRVFPIDDEKTAEIAYESGDLDFTKISLSSLENYRQKPPPNSVVKVYPALYYQFVGMNSEHPKLKNKKVRQAIQWAIDVPSILDAAYFGLAEPATGIVPPGLLGHRPKSLIPPQADFEKAKQILSETEYKDGLELTMDVLNSTTNTTAAQVIQANLAQIGIQLEINIHESGSFWTLGDEKSGDRWKDLQLVLQRYSMTPDAADTTSWFISEQVGVWNWERWKDPEFDKLNEEALAELDPEKREKMYWRLQDIMEETGCYRFITHSPNATVYRKNLEPALRPDGMPLMGGFKAT